MLIQQIRNATVRITCSGIVFLIDPWLQDQGTGMCARTVRPEMAGVKSPLNELPDTPENILIGTDCCLVTHLHPDHFTPDYLPRDLRIIAQNEADARQIEEMGFTHVGWFETDTITIDDVTIHKTKAVHGDNPDVVERMGEACGYVFEAPGEKTLYLAGDTIWCEACKRTIDQYHPEVILLNCCEATTPRGRLIMDLADLENVCRKVPDAMVIASHLDAVNHALLTREDVRSFIREKGLSQAVVPDDGEVTAV